MIRVVSKDTSLDRGEVRRGLGRSLEIQREGLLKKEGAWVVPDETFVKHGEPVVVDGERFPVLKWPLAVDGEPVVVDGERFPVLNSPFPVRGERFPVLSSPFPVPGEPFPRPEVALPARPPLNAA